MTLAAVINHHTFQIHLYLNPPLEVEEWASPVFRPNPSSCCLPEIQTLSSLQALPEGADRMALSFSPEPVVIPTWELLKENWEEPDPGGRAGGRAPREAAGGSGMVPSASMRGILRVPTAAQLGSIFPPDSLCSLLAARKFLNDEIVLFHPLPDPRTCSSHSELCNSFAVTLLLLISDLPLFSQAFLFSDSCTL